MLESFENYFVRALHDAKIQELIDSYSERGFRAEKNVRVDDQQFDLLLHNSDTNQNLAFEVKTLPLDKSMLDRIEQLRKKIQNLGYEFRLVTVSRPAEYKIDIDWFNQAAFEYITKELPDEILDKASHVYYEGVDTHIESIEINGIDATVQATGTIYVELQYGSNSDLRNDMGYVTSGEFPFEGEFKLDLVDKSVIDASIQIDDSHFVY